MCAHVVIKIRILLLINVIFAFRKSALIKSRAWFDNNFYTFLINYKHITNSIKYFFSLLKIVDKMSLKLIIVISLVLSVLSEEDFSFMKDSAKKIKEAIDRVQNVTHQKYSNCKIDYKRESDNKYLEFLTKYNKTLKDVQKAINIG